MLQPAVPNLLPALPEIVLAVGAMALLMLGVFRKSDSTNLITGLSIGLFIVALILTMLVPGGTTMNGAFVMDSFARAMKVLIFGAAAIALSLGVDFVQREGYGRFELPILLMLATLGMGMMVSANTLIALYLGLELQALALYVTAAINRDSPRAAEAGLKYFVLGALSSGMLLYGASLVYGFTGQTEFAAIADTLAANGVSAGVVFGVVFMLAGFAFKISAVPFHMWTPDVYEGAPTPITAFFAAAPKVAAMALLVRVAVDAFEPATREWQQVLSFIAIASMALGAFAAIGQTNIKRLMAYSSIGHMGFALVGLAAGSQAGVQGVVVYMAIYAAMTLGTFAVILSMRRSGGMVEEIDELSGLARTNPLQAFFLAMLLFSLAGIPPLAGFFAKYFVFLAAIEAELYVLAVIGVLASVVGAVYYLRIIKIMYFDEPVDAFEPAAIELKTATAAAGTFVIFFVLVAGPITSWAGRAAASLF
ncbi:MAG: NADH-quinone oxidoreductase subunit NuoN [Devosiaceae bacterium]|nr:NADH-quinone oxidoreductase subunit NuoN [Devosiaceae bacterium MH13]